MTVHGIEADQRTGTAAGEDRGRAELATGSEAGVLVLGGSGLLGRALGAAYDAAGIWAFAPPRPVVDATDAAALATMVEALRPAVVVNAAAFTGVDAAEEHREACRAVNAGIAASLADAVAGIEATLIHISTDFVFDGEADRPYHEYDAVAPVNWYGATKEEGERAVRASGCRHVILRTAWLHGSTRRSFVSAFLDRLRRREGRCRIGPRRLADLGGRARGRHNGAHRAPARRQAGAVGHLSFRRQGRRDAARHRAGDRCGLPGRSPPRQRRQRGRTRRARPPPALCGARHEACPSTARAGAASLAGRRAPDGRPPVRRSPLRR